MLLGRRFDVRSLRSTSRLSGPVEGLLGNAEDLDQRADRDVGPARHHVEDTMVRTRQALPRRYASASRVIPRQP
jgi:hypothetical protein